MRLTSCLGAQAMVAALPRLKACMRRARLATLGSWRVMRPGRWLFPRLIFQAEDQRPDVQGGHVAVAQGPLEGDQPVVAGQLFDGVGRSGQGPFAVAGCGQRPRAALAWSAASKTAVSGSPSPRRRCASRVPASATRSSTGHGSGSSARSACSAKAVIVGLSSSRR